MYIEQIKTIPLEGTDLMYYLSETGEELYDMNDVEKKIKIPDLADKTERLKEPFEVVKVEKGILKCDKPCLYCLTKVGLQTLIQDQDGKQAKFLKKYFKEQHENIQKQQNDKEKK